MQFVIEWTNSPTIENSHTFCEGCIVLCTKSVIMITDMPGDIKEVWLWQYQLVAVNRMQKGWHIILELSA